LPALLAKIAVVSIDDGEIVAASELVKLKVMADLTRTDIKPAFKRGSHIVRVREQDAP
jgi:hypothetical protein